MRYQGDSESGQRATWNTLEHLGKADECIRFNSPPNAGSPDRSQERASKLSSEIIRNTTLLEAYQILAHYSIRCFAVLRRVITKKCWKGSHVTFMMLATYRE